MMTPLESARRVAITYRNTLHRIAPHECARLDRQHIEQGQGWVAPVTLNAEAADNPELFDAELRARDIETIWRIPAATIRVWASRGLLEKRCGPNGVVVYRLGDVLATQARVRPRDNGSVS